MLVAAVLALAITVPVFESNATAGADQNDRSSLRELQRQRDDVRRKAANKASQVNVLKASDAEVSAALDALNANVNAQRDKLEEAERVVDQANSDQAAAEKAQQEKQKELDELLIKISDSAIDSYISMNSVSDISVNSEDINDAVNKKALMSMRATENVSLTERFRSVQEDLETQRQAATDAAERAAEAKDAVNSHYNELSQAQAKQQAFADQLDARIESALAEADSLASIDASLSKSISNKQAAIAKALAAERAAAARREAIRAAQNRRPTNSGGQSSNSGSSGGGGGGGGGGPISIVGSGEIVSVQGIQIHRSMAGNLASLLSAAAADGIHLSGGGYRSSAGQIAVRRNNCGTSHYAIYQMPASSCRPPTARPGSSMHERGLAIDFTQGGRTLTRGSSGFAWMRANAGRFGFRNLPSEPWHWSSNGN